MVKRWIIRGVLIGLILLFAGGWAWSYWYYDKLDVCYESHTLTIGAAGGSVGLLHFASSSPPAGLRWSSHYYHFLTPPANRQALTIWLNEPGQPRYLSGFGIVHETSLVAGTRSMAAVPYWFLGLLASAGLVLTWRKKSRRSDAFPVETGPNLDPRLPDAEYPQIAARSARPAK